MSRVRLIDIAAEVGVSAKTVSNVVNGTGMVSEEVRARILEVIDDLGYRPNLTARHLRTGTSGTVALVIPELKEPYFAELAASFCDAAHERGMTVIVSQSHGDRETELQMCEGIGMPALQGLAMSPLALTPDDIASRRSTVPLVLIGEHAESLTSASVAHVGIDNVSASAAATQFLLDRGRRRIAVIGVQDAGSTATSRLRLEGYRQSIHGAGLPIDPALFGPVPVFNRAEGHAAASRLLASGVEFDAMFCFSDSLAFGAMYSLATHGMTVPDDVLVIGFDNIEEGRYSVPSFATVSMAPDVTSNTILDILAVTERRKPGEPTDDALGGKHVTPFSIVARDDAPSSTS